MRIIESWLPDAPGEVLVAGGTAAALFHLQRAEVALAIWHRPLPGNLVEPAQRKALAALAAARFDIALDADAGTAMDAVAAALPAPAPLHFLLDMMTVVGLFAALAGLPRAALRLASQPAPGWPGPAPGIRMLASYAPPGLTLGGVALPPGSLAALRAGDWPGLGTGARMLLEIRAP